MKRAIPLILLGVCLSVSAFAGRSLHDELGRVVTVPDHPHRLVCLAPSITDTIYALGRGEDIVGITDYTKYPPEAKKKPSVGGVINPSLERLVSLKPDLVLAIGELNNQDLTRAIEKLGFPVFVIHPHGFQDIYRSIMSMGAAIDAEREASALVARLREREAAVRKSTAGKQKPRVFFLLWPDPIMTAGSGAFITELIELAGGKSITADLPNEWPRLSFESLVAEQPEYLLLVRGTDTTLESLRKRGGWQRLQAVRDGKVLYTDERIEYPSAMAFVALEDLAAQFHDVSSKIGDRAKPR